MGKSRRTVSLDESHNAWLEDPDRNASGLINDLIEHYRRRGRTEDVALGMRFEHLKGEIKRLEERRAEIEEELSNKRTERDRIAEKLEVKETRIEDAVEDFLALNGNPDHEPDNPAVKNYANKAGLVPEDFIEKVEAQTQS